MTPTVTLPDGAKLAYDVYGAEHAARVKPIVLVGGAPLQAGQRIPFSRSWSCRNGIDQSGLGKIEQYTLQDQARSGLRPQVRLRACMYFAIANWSI